MDVAKLMKKLPTGWAEEAEAMDEAQLRNVIVESTNNIAVTKQDMEESPGFQEAKEQYKLAAGPYKDAMKAQQAKIAYALKLLADKGKI